jgi:hypothetical protein
MRIETVGDDANLQKVYDTERHRSTSPVPERAMRASIWPQSESIRC